MTLSFNDSSPELAACVRRGPFAVPDENEMLDYLFSRKRANRASAEQYSVYHVISYQRRLNWVKNEFFARGCATPLGNTIDWWARAFVVPTRSSPSLLEHPVSIRLPVHDTQDRTEAQQRGALHSHILGNVFCLHAGLLSQPHPPHTQILLLLAAAPPPTFHARPVRLA